MLNWDSRAGSSGYGTLRRDAQRVVCRSRRSCRVRRTRPPRRVHLGIQDSPQGVHDVRRGKLSAIVEANAGTKAELPGQSVDGPPPLEQRGPDLAVRVPIEQGLEDQPEEALRLGAVDLEWIERRRRGRRVGDDQVGAVGGRATCLRQRGHDRQARSDQRPDHRGHPSMSQRSHMAILPPRDSESLHLVVLREGRCAMDVPLARLRQTSRNGPPIREYGRFRPRSDPGPAAGKGQPSVGSRPIVSVDGPLACLVASTFLYFASLHYFLPTLPLYVRGSGTGTEDRAHHRHLGPDA